MRPSLVRRLAGGEYPRAPSCQAVEIRVRDNGTSIPKKLQAKIFQPFFTTKPPGEGTGLGLSLSYGIVTQTHGGTLTVASKEGQFTELTISLPSEPTGAELTDLKASSRRKQLQLKTLAK